MSHVVQRRGRGRSVSEISDSSPGSSGPVAMLNALWFRPGGMELYGQYGQAVLPMLAEVGAQLSTPFLEVEDPLEGGFDPDLVGFVRYPSATAFDEMWRSERYRRVAHLRTDAVHRAVLTRCAIEPSDSSEALLDRGVIVLNMLWFHEGGREWYDEYLAAAAPLVEAVGGRYVVSRFLPDLAYRRFHTRPGFSGELSIQASGVRFSDKPGLRRGVRNQNGRCPAFGDYHPARALDRGRDRRHSRTSLFNRLIVRHIPRCVVTAGEWAVRSVTTAPEQRATPLTHHTQRRISDFDRVI